MFSYVDDFVVGTVSQKAAELNHKVVLVTRAAAAVLHANGVGLVLAVDKPMAVLEPVGVGAKAMQE